MTGFGNRPAVFLDRDGTINENVFNPASGRWEAPLRVMQFHLVSGAVDAMRRLQEAGFLLILVSNQPNYALGKATLQEMAAIHDRLLDRLSASSVVLDDAFYCYHHPNGHVPEFSGPCACRKPSPHFLEIARDRHGIAMARSWMVGDRASDVACGQNAGVRTAFLTSTGHIVPDPAARPPDFQAAGLSEAVDRILADQAAVALSCIKR